MTADAQVGNNVENARATNGRQFLKIRVTNVDASMDDILEIDEKSEEENKVDDVEEADKVQEMKGSINPNEDMDLLDEAEKEEPLEGSLVEVPEGVMVGKGHLICQPLVRWNLICMIWMWSATLFSIFTINFYLKYVPGGVFLNFSISGLSEVFANGVVGLVFKHLKVRWTFFTGFCIATVGGTLLIFQNSILGIDPDDPTRDESQGAILIAVFVLFAKFGCAMCQCCCFIATPWLFPTSINATAFGICNLVGRMFAVLAPMIAELEAPLPMEIFTGMTLISIFVSLLIKMPKN